MSSDDLLHIGDVVYLGESSMSASLAPSAVLLSQGWSDTSVVVEASRDSAIPREGLFRLRAQQNYAAEVKLSAALSRMNKTRMEARGDDSFAHLFKEREKEKRNNLQEFEMAKGREIRYGMVIQLQHVISDNYLRVSRQSAEQTRDSWRVEIYRDAAESGWFRIMPRLRVHSEGDRVHMGDPVVFENVSTGFNLAIGANALDQLSGSGAPSFPRREVCATNEPSALKILRYRSFADTRQVRSLLGGAPVRLIHKEAEGTIASEAGQIHIATEVHDKVSANAVWSFQKVDRSGLPLTVDAGNALGWESTFRLLHVATGCFLGVELLEEVPQTASDNGNTAAEVTSSLEPAEGAILATTTQKLARCAPSYYEYEYIRDSPSTAVAPPSNPIPTYRGLHPSSSHSFAPLALGSPSAQHPRRRAWR